MSGFVHRRVGRLGAGLIQIVLCIAVATPIAARTPGPGDSIILDRVEFASLGFALATLLGLVLYALRRSRRRERKARDLASRQQREDSFRAAIIQHAAEGMCVCHDIPDPPYVRFTVWNDRMTEITGYSLDEINHRGWYEAVYPDEEIRGLARARMERMRQGEDLFAEEWEITRADGRKRVVLISTTAVRNIDGQTHALALMNDITERKRADTALRESEERLRATLDNTPGVAVQWYDRSGRVLYWNPASETLYGHRAQHAVGRTLDQLIVSTEEFQNFLSKFADIEKTGRPFGPAESAVRLADGSEGLVLYTIFVIPGESNEPIFVCMDVDITERKRAELALRRSEERFHVFMEHSPMIAFYKDEAGRLLYINPTFERRFRFHGRDWYGKTDAELWTSDVAEELRRNDIRILGSGVSESFEEKVLFDGQWQHWLTYKFRFEDSAGNRFLGGLGIDLTERKQLEEQLLQAQKLESIGRLAGGVAHDFNNVLTAIIGSVEIAEARLGADNTAHIELGHIRSAAERAAGLTRQLLAFARRQIIEPKIVNLNVIVQDVESLLQRLIGEHIALKVERDESLGSTRVDRGQIEQVLLNLGVNARDAMPNGGTLTIRTRNIDLAADTAYAAQAPPGRYVELSVADTGIGMDETVRQRVFEPFFTTKTLGEGTGLGLATAYGIVRQSEGHIRVESAVGAGTTFRVLLPRVDAAPNAPPAPHAACESCRGVETVLVVEDEPMVRGIAVAVLRNAGYTVLSAGDGEEATAVAEKHDGSIELLLADVILPGDNGPEVARQLVRQRPNLRVLFVSGYTDDAIGRYGVLDPGVQFLQKPYTPETLSRKVREVLDMPAPQAQTSAGL